MEEYFSNACERCPYFDDKDTTRRNKQYDIIYCSKCQDSFERRMKPWHCPFSPLCKEKDL